MLVDTKGSKASHKLHLENSLIRQPVWNFFIVMARGHNHQQEPQATIYMWKMLAIKCGINH